MNLKINAIEVIQPIGKFYICKMKSTEVYKLAKVDSIRISKDEDNLYKGVQRKLNSRKVEKIKSYLHSKDATFPNSIILNLKDEYFVDYSNGFLEIKESEDAFTIIDGQHRIEGLKESKINNFEIVLSIFIGLDTKDQSRVFVTINSEQTKVDPSLSLYQELNDDLYTPRKFVVKLAEVFNIDEDSPWKNKLKLVGYKDELSEEGILTLKAFVTPLLDLIYDDNQFNDLRNLIINGNNNYNNIKKNLLWEIYYERKEDVFYKMLLNFFKAIKELFPSEWGKNDSLLNKTTGYNAMMILFNDALKIGLKNNDLSYDFFLSYLRPIKKLDGKINRNNFSTSGYQAAKDLYEAFIQQLK